MAGGVLHQSTLVIELGFFKYKSYIRAEEIGNWVSNTFTNSQGCHFFNAYLTSIGVELKN